MECCYRWVINLGWRQVASLLQGINSSQLTRVQWSIFYSRFTPKYRIYFTIKSYSCTLAECIFSLPLWNKKIHILHFHVNHSYKEAENVQTFKKQFLTLTPISLSKIYCPKRWKHQLCSSSIAWGYGVLMKISLN